MATMTEPKKRKRSPEEGRPKAARGPRKIIFTFKGYEEFDDWLKRLSLASRLPVSILVEHALIRYAQAHGFSDPPPER